MATEALTKRPRYIVGTRPVHVHRDPETNDQWECNSPYCTELEIAHPQNGGPTPIVQGYEPWRR